VPTGPFGRFSAGWRPSRGGWTDEVLAATIGVVAKFQSAGPQDCMSMTAPLDKRILIVAGPNGAGKTTFARQFLPLEAGCPTFVNADLIADGLSPFAAARVAVRAGRLMLKMMVEYLERGESFAFETTLAGRNYARSIPRWRAAGYRVTLHFLSLPSPEMAVARVAERVRQGGHHVPEDIIRRRFASGKDNFDTLYKPIVDSWLYYDNSGEEPILLEAKENR
jgi:predicted ABC-type ATPase